MKTSIQRTALPAATRRPLDPESTAVLYRLTAGLADPAGFGLIAHELGSATNGAPTVAAERLSADRYVVTRYIELDTRTEDPEVNDRVAAPEVEFVREGDDWFPIAARRGHFEGDEHDTNTLAVALLRLVTHEHAGELARGLDWPTSPGVGLRASRTSSSSWFKVFSVVARAARRLLLARGGCHPLKLNEPSEEIR